MAKTSIESRPFTITIPKVLYKAKIELDWLFYYGDASLGIKSNMGSMINALASDESHEVMDAEDQLISYIDNKVISLPPEKLFRNVKKYNRIERNFRKLSNKNQRILEFFYREKQFDKSIEQYFGAGLCLLYLLEEFESEYVLRKELMTNPSKVKGMKDKIHSLYKGALEEYYENMDHAKRMDRSGT